MNAPAAASGDIKHAAPPRPRPSPMAAKLTAALLNHASTKSVNVASFHACSLASTESARVDGGLMDDFEYILRGNCVCLSHFCCSKVDLSLYDALKADLVAHSGESLSTADESADVEGKPSQSRGLIDWSKHEVYENPTQISPTFNAVVDLLEQYFDVEVYASRLNYYRDGNSWKPFHHDSHAYGGKGLREDFTVGISLGQSRDLQFLHEPSGKLFNFPQDNGDCFAFTSEVNSRFMHGVPKNKSPNCGDRFSVIVWGRRRSVNERNGGGSSMSKLLANRSMTSVDDAVQAAYEMVSASGRQPSSSMGSREASATESDAAKKQDKADKKKKNRLQ